MAIEDYVGQRIRLRAEINDVGHRSGRWSAERILHLREVYHAGTGEFLGAGRTVVYAKSVRRDDVVSGATVEFTAKISKPRGEDYCAIVDASDFEVM